MSIKPDFYKQFNEAVPPELRYIYPEIVANIIALIEGAYDSGYEAGADYGWSDAFEADLASLEELRTQQGDPTTDLQNYEGNPHSDDDI